MSGGPVRVPASLDYLDRNYAHPEPGNSSEIWNNWAEQSGCSLKCLFVVKWLLYHQCGKLYAACRRPGICIQLSVAVCSI